MPGTLILKFHPGYVPSKVNTAMTAATAGQAKDTYRPGCANLYPLEELLRPWECTANQSHFAYELPFLAYGADDYDDADRAKVAHEYAARIKGWTATKPEAA
jgi:glutathione-regulated potassium-efflux system ancillary protein KefG